MLVKAVSLPSSCPEGLMFLAWLLFLCGWDCRRQVYQLLFLLFFFFSVFLYIHRDWSKHKWDEKWLNEGFTSTVWYRWAQLIHAQLLTLNMMWLPSSRKLTSVRQLCWTDERQTGGKFCFILTCSVEYKA